MARSQTGSLGGTNHGRRIEYSTPAMDYRTQTRTEAHPKIRPYARSVRKTGLGLDDPSPDRPVLHCNFGGALSAPSVDTGFSCVADSDLSGQVRRFASDESAASSRQSVGCGCLLGPVATAVNRRPLYSNSASS